MGSCNSTNHSPPIPIPPPIPQYIPKPSCPKPSPPKRLPLPQI